MKRTFDLLVSVVGLILLGHAPAAERKSLVSASIAASLLFAGGAYFVGDPYLKTIEKRLPDAFEIEPRDPKAKEARIKRRPTAKE